MVLAAVTVARVDDHALGQVRLTQAGKGVRDCLGIVVRSVATTTKNDMAVGVARGTDQGSLAVEVRSGEHVARCRGAGAVDGYLYVAFGGVLDTDGHGQRAAQLTVNLTGGGPGADRTVADQVGNVLRHDRIKELAADRQAQARHVEKQLAADTEPGVDVERAVEVGVVEQALPPECGARLFEVDAHDDVQIVPQFFGLGGQPAGVVHRRFRIVHRARTDYDDQTIVVTVEDVDGVGPTGAHSGGGDLVRSVLSTNSRR